MDNNRSRRTSRTGPSSTPRDIRTGDCCGSAYKNCASDRYSHDEAVVHATATGPEVAAGDSAAAASTEPVDKCSPSEPYRWDWRLGDIAETIQRTHRRCHTIALANSGNSLRLCERPELSLEHSSHSPAAECNSHHRSAISDLRPRRNPVADSFAHIPVGRTDTTTELSQESTTSPAPANTVRYNSVP